MTDLEGLKHVAVELARLYSLSAESALTFVDKMGLTLYQNMPLTDDETQPMWEICLLWEGIPKHLRKIAQIHTNPTKRSSSKQAKRIWCWQQLT